MRPFERCMPLFFRGYLLAFFSSFLSLFSFPPFYVIFHLTLLSNYTGFIHDRAVILNKGMLKTRAKNEDMVEQLNSLECDVLNVSVRL